MPPEVLRNPIDEIYGYTCKKKTQTTSAYKTRSFILASWLDGHILRGHRQEYDGIVAIGNLAR